MNKPILLSNHARELAEKRAQAEGFESVGAYVDALIENDGDDEMLSDWARQRIEEGLASPNAGEMTREKLERLMAEGMAKARKA
ncbi:MAG TPA: hypothetical protein VHU87_05770 [Rhizomicrobium sp.]|nr:hypothetical protein [Rhizomicrobium sp.]